MHQHVSRCVLSVLLMLDVRYKTDLFRKGLLDISIFNKLQF